jgi:hypothetical protein
VWHYKDFPRRFLADPASRTASKNGAEGLASSEVNALMLDVSARLVVESAKRGAADLRCCATCTWLRRWKRICGRTMPPLVAWRGSALPRTMRPAEVDALIASCDRPSLSGRTESF